IPSNASASTAAFKGTYQTSPYESNYRLASAMGGIVPSFLHYAAGGGVDNVPALLTGGEFVVRKDVVDRLGRPFFDKVNNGVAKFADGGIVGAFSSTTSSNGNLDKLIS